MGVGLVKSYSRGAWVGAAVGVAYLLLNAEGRRKNAEWGKAETGEPKAETARGPRLVRRAVRRWLALAVICGSVAVLGFWSFGHTERAVARRAYSVVNGNDFSWRNRVAAWEGGLQMMSEKPWFGFGWNRPERVYSALYRPAKVDEGMAIQLNDFLMLGMTLGLPARRHGPNTHHGSPQGWDQGVGVRPRPVTIVFQNRDKRSGQGSFRGQYERICHQTQLRRGGH
jgi:O-antigen ligase